MTFNNIEFFSSECSVQPLNSNQQKANSIRIYGDSAALLVEPEVISHAKRNFYTIGIDCAPSCGKNNYDWARKIRVRLTLSELYELIRVCLGKSPSFKAAFHGEANNRGFEFTRIENSLTGSGGVILKTWEGKNPAFSAIMRSSDLAFVTSLCLRAMSHNMGISPEAAIAIVRMTP